MARAKKMRLPEGWRYEPVNTRMRASCAYCGEEPEGVRLKYTMDAYPFPKTMLFCTPCGVAQMRIVLREHADLVDQFAAVHLKGSDATSAIIPAQGSGPPQDNPRDSGKS